MHSSSLGGYVVLGGVRSLGRVHSPEGVYSPGGMHDGIHTTPPPLWTEWHTPVKISPFRKLCLRAVIKSLENLLPNYCWLV